MQRLRMIGAFAAGLVLLGSTVVADDHASGTVNRAKDSAKAAGKTVAAQVKDSVRAGQDIVDIAIANGNFKTLVAAVQAAGLVETLKGAGPFTVFAPTDSAFGKLPKGTVEALLKDKAKLASILTYHVVPGKVMASDVMKVKSAKTVQGQEVTVKVDSAKVMIDNATVLMTDIIAKNGVIHVIDNVILPKEDKK